MVAEILWVGMPNHNGVPFGPGPVAREHITGRDT